MRQRQKLNKFRTVKTLSGDLAILEDLEDVGDSGVVSRYGLEVSTLPQGDVRWHEGCW